MIDELGGPKHFNHFPAAWAHAMDTPFQWTKQIASHFGGTRNPMIVSWPAQDQGQGRPARASSSHVIDIVPTLYEVIGITPPTELNGVTAEADRRYQLRLHVRRRQGQGPAHDAVLRDGDQPGHLPRRLDGVGHFVSTVGTESHKDFDPDKQKWELYNIDAGLLAGRRSRSQQSAEAPRAARSVVGGGGEVQRPAAGLARGRTVERRADGPAEPWR